MSVRSNAKLDADHTPIPTWHESWRPITCNVCKRPCRQKLFPQGDGTVKATWAHGSAEGSPIKEPDADLVLVGGWTRHYRDKTCIGRTLCGIRYTATGGRIMRLSDNPPGAVCGRCIRSNNKRKRIESHQS